MTEQRPKRPTVRQWADFLQARLEEEAQNEAVMYGHGAAWEVTGPGARRFGVQVGGRVLAPVLTGLGVDADEATARHIVRHQPRHTAQERIATAELIGLLRHTEETRSSHVAGLESIVKMFRELYRDHPDHPECEPPEEM
ncbi:DUF6221 family protein [Streptomyces sp. NPDC051041]|uniref:DUF6221 family protein n=1 Tax=Streptomyces sp. NPDC051041 TaxID=3365640 RepID=UPI0037AC2FA2